MASVLPSPSEVLLTLSIAAALLTARPQTAQPHGHWIFDPPGAGVQGNFRMTLKSSSGPEATLVIEGEYSLSQNPNKSATMHLTLLYADSRPLEKASSILWRFSDGTTIKNPSWPCQDRSEPCFRIINKHYMDRSGRSVKDVIGSIHSSETLDIDTVMTTYRKDQYGIIRGKEDQTTTTHFDLDEPTDFLHHVCAKNDCLIEGDL